MIHANNINTLWLLAAFQVVLSHSVGHLGIASDDHPAVLVLRMFPGVPIFFLLSGFLIYRSWTWRPDLRSYFIKRVGDPLANPPDQPLQKPFETPR